MITITNVTNDDNLLGLYAGDVIVLTTESGLNHFSITELKGDKPTNFGSRSLLGDTSVVHIHLDGNVCPPFTYQGSPTSPKLPVIMNPFDSSDFSLSWTELPNKPGTWCRIVSHPNEVHLLPAVGATVLEYFRVEYVTWGRTSYPRYGWWPYGHIQYYVGLYRKNGQLKSFSLYTTNSSYFGGTLTYDLVDPSFDQYRAVCWTHPDITISVPYRYSDSDPYVADKTQLNIDYSSLLASCTRLLDWDRSMVDDAQLTDLRSAASQEICERAQALNVNGIAYIKDIVDLFISVKSGDAVRISEKLSRANSFLRKARISADAYLSLKYGLPLTAKDTKKIIRALEKEAGLDHRFKIGRAAWTYQWSRKVGKQTLTYTWKEHYKCVYDSCDSGVAAMIDRLYDWDLALSLENAWDLIPFSFVVDWILPIGDFLDQYDKSVYLQLLPIKDVVRSSKICFDVPDVIYQNYVKGAGYLGVTHYVRGVESQLPPIYPKFDGLKKFHNFLEFGAILIQKIARK